MSATAGMSNGGGGGGAGAGTRPTDVPASESQADIRAFLENELYKQAPWISDVDAPREGKPGSQHDGPVRVWENATLVSSLKGGHDGRNGNPFPDQWSMAVKEFYDTAGTLVGRAAAFKQGSETTRAYGAWTYFCYGPGTRCASTTATIDAPIYSNGAKSPGMQCGICHDASIFTVPQ